MTTGLGKGFLKGLVFVLVGDAVPGVKLMHKGRRYERGPGPDTVYLVIFVRFCAASVAGGGW